jgi:hypothetical protein
MNVRYLPTGVLTAPKGSLALYADLAAQELIIYAAPGADPADWEWAEPYIDLAAGGLPLECVEYCDEGADVHVVRINRPVPPVKPARHLRLVHSA